MSTEELVNDLRHNPAVEMEVTDHEGGKWQLSFLTADPATDDADSIEYRDPNGDEDEVEADAFISLHSQYTWTIDAIR